MLRKRLGGAGNLSEELKERRDRMAVKRHPAPLSNGNTNTLRDRHSILAVTVSARRK